MVTSAAVKQFSLGCDYGYTNRSSKSAAEGNARRSLPLLSARPPVTSPATESLSIDCYQTVLVNDRATCVNVCERLVRGRRGSGIVEVIETHARFDLKSNLACVSTASRTHNHQHVMSSITSACSVIVHGPVSHTHVQALCRI